MKRSYEDIDSVLCTNCDVIVDDENHDAVPGSLILDENEID